MKLITNTIEEAKENADLCIKDSFEPETIFDCNMKDLASNELKNSIVNGSVDSSCKNVKKVNGSVENKKNGLISSSDLAKPVVNGHTSFSDCEDISDGELNFVLSDEEENLLEDKDTVPKSNSVKDKSPGANPISSEANAKSDKVVNGFADNQNCAGKSKDVTPETESDDSSHPVQNKNEDLKEEESQVVKFDITEVTENVKETVEICTTNEEIDDSCPPVELSNLESKEDNSAENDDGSDAENDREAEEKLLTLLKETPPGLVILPEEHNESEKDAESGDEESKLLSLLEDSQSDSNLNLLNDVIGGSSGSAGFEGDHKLIQETEKPKEKLLACEDDSAKLVDSKCKLSNESDPVADSDERIPKVDCKSSCNLDLEKKTSSVTENESISSDALKDDVKVVSEMDSGQDEGKVTSEIVDLKNDVVSNEQAKTETEISSKTVTVKEEICKESLNEPPAEMPNKEAQLDSNERDAVTSSKEEEISEKDSEGSENTLINPDCKSDQEICDDKVVSSKRNLLPLSTLNSKRLKRSTSVEQNEPVDEKVENNVRKRSYSVDDQVKSEKIDVKRLRRSIENGGVKNSETLDEKEENDKPPEEVVKEKDRTDCDEKSDEIKPQSCEINSSKNDVDNSRTSDSDGGSKSVVNDVDNESVEKTMDISDKDNGIENDLEVTCKEDSGKLVDKRKSSCETKVSDVTSSVPSDDTVDSTSKPVAQKTWKNITKDLSCLTKIHKDKFRSLSRFDLEELIVQKICESIGNRSEIGELRQRVKSLEQAVESWRKKSLLLEKCNREINTVLTKYLREVDDQFADKNNRPIIPIKITRSVGLQVTPPAALDKFKGLNRGSHSSSKQADNIRTLRPSPSSIRENVTAVAAPKPSTRAPTLQRASPAAARPVAPKTTPPKQQQQVTHNAQSNITNSGVKRLQNVEVISSPASGTIANNKRVVAMTSPVSSTPVNSSSDLEVIDLTDKDERTIMKGVVSPSNVRLVSRPNTNTLGISSTAVGQQMTFVVPTSAMQAVRGNQRQQLFLTTTTTNGTAQIRPVASATVVANRSNSALAIPGGVMMKGYVPISSQAATAGVVVRSSSNTLVARNMPQLRLSSPVTVTPSLPLTHPAPLPISPPPVSQVGWLHIPPRPILKVSKTNNGIMLSWSMTLNKNHEEIASYQLYAYQESNIPPNSNLWKKVGDVKALPLPMACTLTQFVEGHKYHFAVRAVDVHSRVGQFSLPSSILLK